jgi:hypothetical protein
MPAPAGQNPGAEVGYAPEDISTGAPTRSARLKWVIIVDSALPAGPAANAAVCVSAATAQAVPGLLGPDGKDANGSVHPGLPWAGCSILAAPAAELSAIRDRAVSSAGTFTADMPSAAQHTRVYDEYLGQLAGMEQISYYAVSIVGPRNRVDKLAGKLPLLR